MCFVAGRLSFPRQEHLERSLRHANDQLSMFTVAGDHSGMEKGLYLCNGYRASQIISVMSFSHASHGKRGLRLTGGRTGPPRV